MVRGSSSLMPRLNQACPICIAQDLRALARAPDLPFTPRPASLSGSASLARSDRYRALADAAMPGGTDEPGRLPRYRSAPMLEIQTSKNGFTVYDADADEPADQTCGVHRAKFATSPPEPMMRPGIRRCARRAD